MPKIKIGEYDNTTAGLNSYANFAVVVPGLVKKRAQKVEGGDWYYGGRKVEGTAKESSIQAAAAEMVRDEEAKTIEEALQLIDGVFDDNGIYECSSQTDFLNYIGYVPADSATIVEPKAPELADSRWPDQITEVEYNAWVKGISDAVACEATITADTEINPEKTYYVKSEEPIPEFVGVGGLYVDIDGYEYTAVPEGEAVAEDLDKYYEIAEGKEGKDATVEPLTDGYLYLATQTSGTVGKLDDGINKYRKVTPQDPWQSSKEYAIILFGDEGIDGVYGAQYGNQIAYELLGLGYTVLYKKLETLEELNNEYFYKCLKDRSIYDFRYILSGLFDGNENANEVMTKLVEHINNDETSGRGDCTALLDIPTSTYRNSAQNVAVPNIVSKVNEFNPGGGYTGKYSAFFAPTVTYKLSDSHVALWGGNKTFPASFHYLACAARAAENYNEWYAIAGYTRGVSNFSIDSVGCKFGENAVNILEPRNDSNGTLYRAVNLIIKIKNAYYLWGNRTAYKLRGINEENGDLIASHFLNIRQLCSTLKKQIYISCRRYTFDPNSDVLWINFCNAIRPTLEKMKGDQGITDYKFIKVKNDKKALLSAKIRIVPIEAVEDFNINVFLEDSIGGIIADVEEE